MQCSLFHIGTIFQNGLAVFFANKVFLCCVMVVRERKVSYRISELYAMV